MTGALPAHRVATSVVEVRAGDRPLADAEVRVEQLRHAFGFGNIGFELLDHLNGHGAPGDDDLARLFLDAFDLAILPFYWADFEAAEGAPRTSRLRAAAEWFAAHGVRTKGHPLVWHTLAPDWLRGRSDAEVLETVRGRIRREVAGFAGLVDVWDVVNEAVIAPVFDNGDNAITPLVAGVGSVEFVCRAFAEARAANPAVALHVNDFDLSSRYEELVDGLLAAGVRIDGIGLQTHMHQGYPARSGPSRRPTGSRGSASRCTSPRRPCSRATSCRPRSSTSTTTCGTTGRRPPRARRGRPPSSSVTTDRCSGIPPSRRSPTGGSPIAARGSALPRGSSGPTAPRSPGIPCCAT